MKNKVVMFNLVALLFASATFAQGVENDDMYFNSKDRAKLKAQKATEEAAYTASIKKVKKSKASDEDFTNPTDSYSARNVNPEFAARSNSQTAQDDNGDYFVNDYRYANSSNLNNWNNNFNSWYGSPWYSGSYFGPSMNSWNSPYYGGYYDSWGNPWGNPYYRSGWSSSFGFYGGSSWNYGWGLNFGFGNPYMNYWSGFGPSYGYGGWYGGYPSTIVVVNGEGGRNFSYGKRGSRGATVTSRQDGTNNRTRSNYVSTPTNGGRNPDGGRVSTPVRSQRQEDYYNRNWRNSQQGGTSPSRSSSNGWNNSSNRSTDSYHRSSDSSPSFSPSRSSSSDGGGSRSSAPASSGSNGRTRGRD